MNTKGVEKMTWTGGCAPRLERHALSVPAEGAAHGVIVRPMCGAHGQVVSAAELSIGLRLAGLTRQDIQKALWTERSLVKTYGPRGTVHLLPAQELPMWTGALSTIPYTRAANTRNEQLSPEQAE